MTMSDTCNCVSYSPTTTRPICTSSSLSTSSSSSSSSQVVDARSPLERQTSRRTTNFFVEDIMRPDFGVRHVPWRSDINMRGVQHQQSSSPSAGPPISSCTTSTTTMANATLRDEVTQPKTKPTPRNVSKSLNDVKVEMLPAWIFCTRYCDRPSSGRE